jgi:hypothetical protein
MMYTYSSVLKLNSRLVFVVEDLETFDLVVLLKYLLQEPFLCVFRDISKPDRAGTRVSLEPKTSVCLSDSGTISDQS